MDTSLAKEMFENEIEAFKDYYDVYNIEDLLKVRSYSVKRKVDILIRLLRDEGGLTYREVSRYLGLRYGSLAHRYRRSGIRDIPRELVETVKRGVE